MTSWATSAASASCKPTLYHCMGINPETTTINDPTGRPQHIVEKPAMRELI